MPGYYKRPDLTEQAIIDGWLHTGDLGHVDDDGFLFSWTAMKDLNHHGWVQRLSPGILKRSLSNIPLREAAVLNSQ